MDEHKSKQAYFLDMQNEIDMRNLKILLADELPL